MYRDFCTFLSVQHLIFRSYPQWHPCRNLNINDENITWRFRSFLSVDEGLICDVEKLGCRVLGELEGLAFKKRDRKKLHKEANEGPWGGIPQCYTFRNNQSNLNNTASTLIHVWMPCSFLWSIPLIWHAEVRGRMNWDPWYIIWVIQLYWRTLLLIYNPIFSQVHFQYHYSRVLLTI